MGDQEETSLAEKPEAKTDTERAKMVTVAQFVEGIILAKETDTERTKQVVVAGYTAGVTAFFALGTIAWARESWSAAFAVAAVAAMVAVACYFMLRRP